MSVEREGSIIRFACNGLACHKNYETDDMTFNDAWREAKVHGWVAANSRGVVWEHYCPTCKKDLGDD